MKILSNYSTIGLLTWQVIILFAAPLLASQDTIKVETLFEWATVQYTGPDPNSQCGQTITYDSTNTTRAVITGLKSWNGVYYATVPRWRPDVPATLNKVVVQGSKTQLEPFPNCEMQAVGDCNALQNVQSMEIDNKGNMWILDVGRRNQQDGETVVNTCPPKLIIYNLADNTVLQTHIFKDSVAPYETSFLNDIAVDQLNQVAYISNAIPGSMVVYDRKSDTARAYTGASTLADTKLKQVKILGKNYGEGMNVVGIDGIALQPSLCRVFYTPLWGDHIYSVPTSALRNFKLSNAEIDAQVIDHGIRPGTFSDGFAFDSNGKLYFGGISDSSLYAWDVNTPLSEAEQIAVDTSSDIEKQADSLNWIDTFGFDNKGGLIFTSNKLQYFLSGATYNENVSNFRIMRAEIGADSYLAAQKSQCDEGRHSDLQEGLKKLGYEL